MALVTPDGIDTCLASGEVSAGHKPVPALLVYCVGVFCVAFFGGGLILGTGPFVGAVVSEGFVEKSQVSYIFEGAFQMLTWGTALAAHLLSRFGPRLTSLFGFVFSFVGLGILATLPKPANPTLVMVAYGLVGWGGNHIYLSGFQFAKLFPEKLGLADGIVAGCFNFAGIVFLLLNIPDFTFHSFFRLWLGMGVLCFVLVLVFFPDRSYQLGDKATISWPTLKYVKNPFDMRDYCASFHHILNMRFFLYVFSFSLSVVYSTYFQGGFVGEMYADYVGELFVNWGSAIIINATVLFGWIVGAVIDRSGGFAAVGFAQAFFCTLGCVVALLRASGAFATWGALGVNCWTQCLQYTIQLVFLHKVVPAEAFDVALIVVLLVQGLFLFIPSPGLEPNPWGEDFGTPLKLFCGLSALLYIWPVTELLRKPVVDQEKQDLCGH